MRNKSKELWVLVKTAMQVKLGRCPFCMRWSARGTIALWGIVALLGLVWPEPMIIVSAIVLAASFTLLTATHSTAFARRVVRETPETGNWSRRKLLLGLCKLSAAAFVSSFGFGIFPRNARAQGNSPCALLCNALYPPGPARGNCISDGARGRGICFEGPCVPAPDPAKGFKPKTDQQTKLAKLLQSSTIPSTLAGSFFRLAYRFQLGGAPVNDLEASVFGALDGLSPPAKQVLDCALRRFEALPLDDRMHLFGPEFAELIDEPISVDNLAPLVADELSQRASLVAFGDADCLKSERPGQPRPVASGGPDPILGYQNTILRINGLRTATYRRPPGDPPLTASELTTEELEHQCSIAPGGQPNCDVQTTPCPGQELEGICLRVPQVHPGDSVFLEGFNFFDVDARVLLRANPPGEEVREIDAHVCGDTATPATEIVDGHERVIADSRVKDMISFAIPTNLPAGIYQVAVLVPNSVGDPAAIPEWGTEGPLPVISVVPAVTATFQIESEELTCVDETHGRFSLGSDEVGILISTIPIGFDLSLGSAQRESFRFDDVDSGEKRDMARVLFQGSNIGAVGMTILGYEIDNEERYEQISGEEALNFLQQGVFAILAESWFQFLMAAAVGAAVGGPVGFAISIAAAYAIIIFRFFWDSPDLIIEDPGAGLDVLELTELTSMNFPLPIARTFTSPNGISVTVTPLDKVAGQYRERRRYRSADEDSTYEITLRYRLL